MVLEGSLPDADSGNVRVRLRGEEGFGLVELLMAMVMLNIGLLAMVAAFNSGALRFHRPSPGLPAQSRFLARPSFHARVCSRSIRSVSGFGGLEPYGFCSTISSSRKDSSARVRIRWSSGQLQRTALLALRPSG